MLLDLRVRFNSAPGESLCVVGDHPALGCWQPSQAIPLTRDSAQDVWSAGEPISVPLGIAIEYKYLLMQDGRFVRWEAFEGNRCICSSDAVDRCGLDQFDQIATLRPQHSRSHSRSHSHALGLSESSWEAAIPEPAADLEQSLGESPSSATTHQQPLISHLSSATTHQPRTEHRRPDHLVPSTALIAVMITSFPVLPSSRPHHRRITAESPSNHRRITAESPPNHRLITA